MSRIVLPDLPFDALLCRYNEIATKGRNRRWFEDLLIRSIRRLLSELGPLRIVRERGRLFIHRADRGHTFGRADWAVLCTQVPKIVGLASVSPGFLVRPEKQAIEQAIFGSFPEVYSTLSQQIPADLPIRYCMRARRSDKSFPLTSNELEISFAELLLGAYPRLKVDLTNPHLCIEVEIRPERAFVSYGRIDAPGGLPAGSGGRVLALLSGGIDSPVACYEMMRRGCSVDYITFHSEPYTPAELIAKVARLVRVLNVYQEGGRLLAVNLLTAQKQIRDRCQERYRTLLYRRLMMRVATVAAHAWRAKALVTGDNIGQVASQTLENLAAISAATPMMVLRPLLTFDKYQTMAVADRIGTLATSETAVPDSCTVFAPASPATSSQAVALEIEEAKLDLHRLLQACVDQSLLICPDTVQRTPMPELGDALHNCLDKDLLRIASPEP